VPKTIFDPVILNDLVGCCADVWGAVCGFFGKTAELLFDLSGKLMVGTNSYILLLGGTSFSGISMFPVKRIRVASPGIPFL